MKPEVIDSFRGEYFFLSNFYLCPVVALISTMSDGPAHYNFPSVEHAYVAKKCAASRNDIHKILACQSGAEVKALGRKMPMRPGWGGAKVETMARLVRSKFDNRDLAAKLVVTSPSWLVEGNTWGDTFWGVCNGVGRNHLGIILMDVRRQLINEGG